MDIKKLDVKPLKWETDYLILGKSNSDIKNYSKDCLKID
jgi:hypothetical protein